MAAAIHGCLGSAETILNIGAGSGNYEPADRQVIAVEPSTAMLRQRSEQRAPAVRAIAEQLPFGANSFDAAMAILTAHHWSDPAGGLREMRRVAQRQVVFFFEPLHTHAFWALEYFPEALHLPTERNPPNERFLRTYLDVQEVRPVLVPADCKDGFGAAFWARPEAYLDPNVQAGMSWLAMLSAGARRAGTERLRQDLETGEWDRRHGHLRRQLTYDAGYRTAVAH